MKKIILIAGACLFVLSLNAQDNKKEKEKPAVSSAKLVAQQANAVFIMKGGKIYDMSNGKVVVVEKEMAMPNGNKVAADGSIVMKDGSKVQMKDGDRITTNGELIQRQAPKTEVTK